MHYQLKYLPNNRAMSKANAAAATAHHLVAVELHLSCQLVEESVAEAIGTGYVSVCDACGPFFNQIAKLIVVPPAVSTSSLGQHSAPVGPPL